MRNIITLLFAAMLLIVGCGAGYQESKLIGEWKILKATNGGKVDNIVKGKTGIEFFKDKTFIMPLSGITGTWIILDDGRIKMQNNIGGGFTFATFQNDTLVWESKSVEAIFICRKSGGSHANAKNEEDVNPLSMTINEFFNPIISVQDEDMTKMTLELRSKIDDVMKVCESYIINGRSKDLGAFLYTNTEGLSKIKILREHLQDNGKKAVVEFNVFFRNGEESTWKADLVNNNGWKIKCINNGRYTTCF